MKINKILNYTLGVMVGVIAFLLMDLSFWREVLIGFLFVMEAWLILDEPINFAKEGKK